MKDLYLVARTDAVRYDEYDSAVVVANNPEEAMLIHPGGWVGAACWTAPENLVVTRLGSCQANFKLNSVVCASFNAG